MNKIYGCQCRTGCRVCNGTGKVDLNTHNAQIIAASKK